MTAIGLPALRQGPKGKAPEVRNAYRYLRGAHRTVSDLFLVATGESDRRRAANADARGRMASPEVDLLRSAIVFTSSGLDASMTRLVIDAGRLLISRPKSGARAQYEQYLKAVLAAPKVENDLKDAITSEDPKRQLLEFYLRSRTKASFQGSHDLQVRVRSVLGISKARIDDRAVKRLDEFFQARNSIVHSMDYQAPDEPRRSRRNHRGREQVLAMCSEAFDVAAEFIHAAAEIISTDR